MILGLAALLIGAPSGAMAHTAPRPSFGAFAGYAWFGSVKSLQGSWTVPRVRPGSALGVAATWIGAQAPGIPHSKAFIQVGTVEHGFWPAHDRRPLSFDYAFWSDIGHHFRAQPLFIVKPGDRLAASLLLLSGRWRVSIVDLTSGKRSRFHTAEEAAFSFNMAEWLQEDPTSSSTHRPLAYPVLSDVHFRRLRLDSTAPRYGALYSQWMSLRLGSLEPSPLRDDAFFVHRARPVSAEGARYLSIAAHFDAVKQRFVLAMSGWQPATPSAQIAAERSSFAAALSRFIHALTTGRWRESAASLVRTMTHGARALLAQTRLTPPDSSAGRRRWLVRWRHDASALDAIAHMLRRRLGVPELTPP
jgi:hypothetical protein